MNNRDKYPQDLVSAYKIATNWKGAIAPNNALKPDKGLMQQLLFFAKLTENLWFAIFSKQTTTQWSVPRKKSRTKNKNRKN